MNDRFAADEFFCRLLHREVLRRQVARVVRAVILGFLIGAWIDLALLLRVDREDYELGSTTTGTIKEVVPASEDHLEVHYRYTVKGVAYDGASNVPKDSLNAEPGAPIEVRISSFSPARSEAAASDASQAVKAGLVLLLIAAIAVPIGLAVQRHYRRPRWHQLRVQLASAVLAPDRSADLTALLPDPGERTTDEDWPLASPLQRWTGWSPDPLVTGVMRRWLKEQPSPVDFAGFLARLREADLTLHPRDAEDPVPLAEPPVVFYRHADDSLDKPLPQLYVRWDRLGKDGVDAFALDLAGFDAAAEAREWEAHWRRMQEAKDRAQARWVYNGKRTLDRVLAKAGLVRDWPRIVPLRHLAGDMVVAEEFLTGPEALAVIDSTQLRFGFVPRSQVPRSGPGVISQSKDTDETVPVRFAYRPGRELRVELGERRNA